MQPPLELVTALATQLEHRRRALRHGAQHVGWKLGMGDRESIAGNIAVGYLTTATELSTGSAYTPEHGSDLHADVEAGVELRDAVDAAALEAAIGGYGLALELVDLRPLSGEPASVIEANVFHRAVVFGALARPAARVAAVVNGEEVASGPWPGDLPDRLLRAAKLLAEVGEQLSPGDRIITGSIVQVPVRPGDRVQAHLCELDLELTISA